MADEEAVAVVVGADERAGDVLLDLGGGTDVVGGRVEDVHTAQAHHTGAVIAAVGRRKKPPFNPRNPEAFASTRRPDSWAGFDLAAAAVARQQADGVGYVLLLDERLIAFDLDDCRDPQSGALVPWAIALVEEADSYTEITPSGTGLRILGLNESIAASLHHTNRKDPGQVEIYHRCPHFITGSGARQPDTPDALRPICDLVGRMLIVAQCREVGSEIFPPRAPNPDAAARIENITAALAQIPNGDVAWEDWSRIGMAVWRASTGSSDGLAAWIGWSAKSRKHIDGACEERWQHWFQSPPSRIGFGTLSGRCSHAANHKIRRNAGLGSSPPSRFPTAENLEPFAVCP